MTLAAKEARLLRSVLADHADMTTPLATLSEDFLGRAEALIDAAWMMSAIPDFRFPQTTGERPADIDEQLQRQFEMFRSAVDDADLHRAMVQRQHMVEPAAAVVTARSMELI